MTDEPSGERLEVRRSARRKKSIAVHREGNVYVVSAPKWMTIADAERHGQELVKRLQKREQAPRSDLELLTRTLWLRLEFLPEAPEPRSVRWAKQETRWGSCTSAELTIRVSEQLRTAPQYVIDAVLVHELAHLLQANHGPEFQELIDRFPDNGRADAFLAGISYAKGLPHDY